MSQSSPTDKPDEDAVAIARVLVEQHDPIGQNEVFILAREILRLSIAPSSTSLASLDLKELALDLEYSLKACEDHGLMNGTLKRAAQEVRAAADAARCPKCGRTPPFPGGTRCQNLQCPLINWLTPSATASASMGDEWIERALDLAYHGDHRDAYRQGQYDARFHIDRVAAYTNHRERVEYLRGYRNGAVREFVIELKDRMKRPALSQSDISREGKA